MHNFCQDAGEEFVDHAILRRVIAIEREYLQSRRLHHAVRNPAAQAVRQAVENNITYDWTACRLSWKHNCLLVTFVLLHKPL